MFNSLKVLQELNTKTQRRQDTKNTEKKDWFLGKIGGWHRFFGEKFGVVQKPRNLSLESLSSYSLLYFGGFFMTKVTKENLQHLAKLCRIRCSSEKQEKLLRDFAEIVAYMEKLSEVNTDDVEPCNYVTEGLAATPLRDDIPQEGLDRETFLKGAPSSIAGLVRVPSIMSPK